MNVALLSIREWEALMLSQHLTRRFKSASPSERREILSEWRVLHGSDPSNPKVHQVPSERFRVN
ncbi:MAG TPA: hypothetical protein VJH94_01100 [Candidatus Paceibacterota bacterium]